MRRDKESIYRNELEKLISEGIAQDEAEAAARERAEEIYWGFVDQGRQMAKDRE